MGVQRPRAHTDTLRTARTFARGQATRQRTFHGRQGSRLTGSRSRTRQGSPWAWRAGQGSLPGGFRCATTRCSRNLRGASRCPRDQAAWVVARPRDLQSAAHAPTIWPAPGDRGLRGAPPHAGRLGVAAGNVAQGDRLHRALADDVQLPVWVGHVGTLTACSDPELADGARPSLGGGSSPRNTPRPGSRLRRPVCSAHAGSHPEAGRRPHCLQPARSRPLPHLLPPPPDSLLTNGRNLLTTRDNTIAAVGLEPTTRGL